MKEISNDKKMLEYGLNEAYSDIFCFSTKRAGGHSTGNYASFNCNWYCGDCMEQVERNTEMLCHMIGIDHKDLIIPRQVHLDRVVDIDSSFLALTPQAQHLALEGADTVITSLRGKCICISTADCIPVICYDPVQRVVAAIHAGWRGTVKRIVRTTLQQMADRYHSRPADIRAVIGPGISLRAFEVGNEVYDAFLQAGFDMEKIAQKYDKWHIDLWEANRLQLVEAGVDAGHIEVSGICTYYNNETFFSARRLGIQSGRILTGIIMR